MIHIFEKHTAMKISLLFFILSMSNLCLAQSIIGSWQQVDEKTCFQSEMKESDTELELKGAFGSSRQAVAKIITFGKKGNYEEGIFSQGKKKGSYVNKYEYRITDQELQLIDSKSGMVTMRYVIDELSLSTLRFHNALKDCESKSFVRIE